MSCYSCVSDRNTKLAQVSMETLSLRRTVCPDVPACASTGMNELILFSTYGDPRVHFLGTSRDAAFISLSSITSTAVGVLALSYVLSFVAV